MLGADRFQPAFRPAENGFIGRGKWLRRNVAEEVGHALVNAARVCGGRHPNPKPAKPEGIARSRARVASVTWQREAMERVKAARVLFDTAQGRLRTGAIDRFCHH
jgi:hypothetical protein